MQHGAFCHCGATARGSRRRTARRRGLGELPDRKESASPAEGSDVRVTGPRNRSLMTVPDEAEGKGMLRNSGKALAAMGIAGALALTACSGANTGGGAAAPGKGGGGGALRRPTRWASR